MTTEELKEYRARYHQEHKNDPEYRERRRKSNLEYLNRNREAVRSRNRENYRKRYIENPGKYISKTYLRRDRRQKQCPIWADVAAIEKFYKECPEGMTVDHIIPLKGTNVSGLHVAENLQYLTREENARKGNRFEEGVS